ncbi:MAG: SufE family protein [Fibrobacteria bacterium]|nr:SufE family protein [Fibrobacteria bacterium]
MTAIDTISQREAEVVEEFALFDEWLDKYEHIIELGKSLSGVDPEFRTDHWKVKGCQSQVWLQPGTEGDLVVFKADSDAAITKGLVALMVRVLSGQPAEAIARAPLGFLESIGLREHLSPTRANGLASMVKQMKLYAAAMSGRGNEGGQDG